MSASTSIPPTAWISRSRLLGLIGGVAALAAAVTAVVLVFAGGSSAAPAKSRPLMPVAGRSPMQDAGRDPSIMTLTPARLAAGALGTGYQLPIRHTGPTMAAVLRSMSPQTRAYTEAVMGLTFRQLKAGAAGAP